MTRGDAIQLAEVLEIVNREVVTGQVEHTVEQYRSVSTGENESVPVWPLRIGWVMCHYVCK